VVVTLCIVATGACYAQAGPLVDATFLALCLRDKKYVGKTCGFLCGSHDVSLFFVVQKPREASTLHEERKKIEIEKYLR
jgi:hypothetical protein